MDQPRHARDGDTGALAGIPATPDTPGASAAQEARRRRAAVRATRRPAMVRSLWWTTAACALLAVAAVAASMAGARVLPGVGTAREVPVGLAACGVLWALATSTSVARWLQPDPAEENWSGVARAERRTARSLAALRDRGWAVLHDRVVPATGTHLAHLVVGPPGLAVVEDVPAPPLLGPLRRPGSPDLAASALLARLAAEEVVATLARTLTEAGIGASPAVAAPGRRQSVPATGAGVEGVAVLPLPRLALWLTVEADRLTAGEVHMVAEAADRAFLPATASVPDDLSGLVGSTAGGTRGSTNQR